MVIELRRQQDLEQFLQRSETEPVLIFKHSTQCGRSAGAMEELTDFMKAQPDVPCGLILVIENRELADDIEDRFGIRHESPQAIVVVKGAPVWHASHRAVTADALRAELGKHTTPWQTA